ncbi:MAG: DUF456 domain-containing protein [Bacteroidales bacterium]|nr:DUF456 domain-containing protein [Bacteroidales bacterium]
MNTVLIILAFICLIVGILGAIIPGLPGPPISWVGLLLASLTPYIEVSTAMLVGTAVAAAVITVLDYVVPSLSTKRNGGSKYGVWGCNIGLVISIIGLPFGPQGLLGVIFWPFIGALVGEYIKSREMAPALKAAWGAFLGFLTGTLLKLVYCVALLVIVIVGLF